MELNSQSDEELLALLQEALTLLIGRREKSATERGHRQEFSRIRASKLPNKQRLLRDQADMRRRHSESTPEPEPEPAPTVVKAEPVYSILEIHKMWPSKSPDTLRRMFRKVPGVEVYPGAEATKLDSTQTRPYTSLCIPECVLAVPQRSR